MPQRPYPWLLKELAFFRRLLVSQQRELAQTSKSSVRGERSKETLEIRADIRNTGRVIADLRAEMAKKDVGILPGEHTPAPGRGVEKTPSSPPPSPHPPPTDILGETGGGALPSTRRGRKLGKGEASKQESGYPKPPPLQRFHPTSVPGFDPTRPPPERSEYARGPPSTLQPPPTKRESIRPCLLPPDTYPRSPGQVLDDFFPFSKKFGFWVFLAHPTVVSVLLSALVERCFVSRMRDFFSKTLKFWENLLLV